MPTYVPKNVDQLREFLVSHREEITSGSYDVAIEFKWLKQLQRDELLLLLRYCKTSKITIARNLPFSKGNKPIFDFLLNEKDIDIRMALARNVQCPDYILEALSHDFFDEVRTLVARNRGTPLKVLEDLAKDNATTIRQAVSMHPALPTHLLNRLARDRAESVRQNIVGHARDPKMEPEMLKRLSVCDLPDVRVEVAKNPATPYPLLEVLARDADKSVRDAVKLRFLRDAKNPLLPRENLEKLLASGDDTVKMAALDNPALPPENLLGLAQDPSERVRQALAKSRVAAASPAVLKLLSQDPSSSVRREVAANTQLDDDTLSGLTLDDSLIVREALLANPRETERRQRLNLCRVCAKPLTKTSMAIMGVCIPCRLKKGFKEG